MAQKETRYRRCDPVQKKYSVERLGDNEEAKERQPAFAKRMKIKDNSEHIQPVLKSPVLYFVEIVSDLFACKWQIFTLWWGRFVPFFFSRRRCRLSFPSFCIGKAQKCMVWRWELKAKWHKVERLNEGEKAQRWGRNEHNGVTNVLEIACECSIHFQVSFDTSRDRNTQLDNNETEPFESRCSNFKQLSQDSGRRKRNYQFNSSFSLLFSLQALA